MALSGHLVTTTDTYNQYKRRAAFDWSAAWDYDTHDWGITWNYSVEILDSDVPTQNTYMSVGQWSVTVNGTTKSGNENGTNYYDGHQFASGTFHLPADSTFTLSGYVYIGASSTLAGTKHDLISSGTEDINSLGPSPEDVPASERSINVYVGSADGVPKKVIAIYVRNNAGNVVKVEHCYLGTESGIKKIY